MKKIYLYSVIAIFISMVVSVSNMNAEIIRMKNGREVDGEIIRETEDMIIVDIGLGPVAYYKEHVSEIVESEADGPVEEAGTLDQVTEDNYEERSREKAITKEAEADLAGINEHDETPETGRSEPQGIDKIPLTDQNAHMPPSKAEEETITRGFLEETKKSLQKAGIKVEMTGGENSQEIRQKLQDLTKHFDQDGEDMIDMIRGGLVAFSAVGIVLSLLLYIYGAFCFHKIAVKLGKGEIAFLAWIPIINFFFPFILSGLPYWWLLIYALSWGLLFIPIVPFILQFTYFIAVLIGILQGLGKSRVLAILLLIPIINLIVLGYLAFSGVSQTVNEKPEKPIQVR